MSGCTAVRSHRSVAESLIGLLWSEAVVEAALAGCTISLSEYSEADLIVLKFRGHRIEEVSFNERPS